MKNQCCYPTQKQDPGSKPTPKTPCHFPGKNGMRQSWQHHNGQDDCRTKCKGFGKSQWAEQFPLGTFQREYG